MDALPRFGHRFPVPIKPEIKFIFARQPDGEDQFKNCSLDNDLDVLLP